MERGPGWRGWAVATLLFVVLTAIGWAFGTAWRWVAHPEIDELAQVDAVYVLGPVETRIDEALAVMDQGVAPLLLATTSVNQRTGEEYATEHCGRQTPGYAVECVIPEPYTTQGEARLLAAQVEEHGWTEVAVITSRDHAARARLWMERCVPVEVLIWEDGRSDGPPGMSSVVHQTGGWVAAELEEGC